MRIIENVAAEETTMPTTADLILQIEDVMHSMDEAAYDFARDTCHSRDIGFAEGVSSLREALDNVLYQWACMQEAHSND